MRKEVKELYASYGVDVFEALRKLKETKISLHCWQLDDVKGFEGDGDLTGGIQTTGNYLGRARNFKELTADLEVARRLIFMRFIKLERLLTVVKLAQNNLRNGLAMLKVED